MNTFFFLLTNFFNFAPLSELMQGAGSVIVTLLISFAIGIFIHYLGESENTGNYLDLHVALDYVWLFKSSLFFLAIVVTTPFFIGMSDQLYSKISFFLAWLVAFIALFAIVIRLYSWVKGDKDDFRLKYLGMFPKSPRDKIVSWKSYWSAKIGSDSRFRERDFFVAFSKQIDSILQTDIEKEWKILPQLLEDFFSYIDNRNKIFLLVFPDFFPKILEWHFILWHKQYLKFSSSPQAIETNIDIAVFEAERIIYNIVSYVTREALSGNTGNASSYFKYIEEHVVRHEMDKIEGEKAVHFYIEYLHIYNDCFDLIPKSRQSYDIWKSYFPKNWKVTKNNLQKYILSRIWFDHFLQWVRPRLQVSQKEYDQELDEVSREMFPDVDPIVWANILSFIFRSWSGSSRAKGIIESKINFGRIGNVFSGWGGDVENNFYNFQNTQFENAIDLAVFLFGRVFTMENLDKWIKEISEASYEKESECYESAQQWKEIFQKLKKHVHENKVSSTLVK